MICFRLNGLFEVLVLGGCTGVGKTAVLFELRRRGEQVLDLEAT